METLSYCQLMERCLAAEARVVELEARPEQQPVGVTDKAEIECLKSGEMANVMPPDYKGCDKGDAVYLYTNAPAALPVTVNLAEDKPADSESEVDDAEAWFDEGWNARGEADRTALVAAGIRVIKGEG